MRPHESDRGLEQGALPGAVGPQQRRRAAPRGISRLTSSSAIDAPEATRHLTRGERGVRSGAHARRALARSAARAGPADHHLVAADLVAQPAPEPLDRLLEALVLERRDAAAALADDVMVVMTAGHDGLVARPALAGLDALDETHPVEEVERPVDARDPDPAAALVAASRRSPGPRGSSPGAREARRPRSARRRSDGPPRASPRSARSTHSLPAFESMGQGYRVSEIDYRYHRRVCSGSDNRDVAIVAIGLASCGELAATTGGRRSSPRPASWPTWPRRWRGRTPRSSSSIPDGSDPHSFALSAEDRLELEQADLVAANGAGLEAGLPLDDVDAPTWELAGNVEGVLPGSDPEEGPDDPHVWMDPSRVAGALPSLADSLADADPANAEAYRQRAGDYAETLLALDREIERALHPIPPPDRELVTSHDALGYFADRYDLDVVATAFPTTGAEAEVSAERLADVEAAVRETGVQAIFAQEGDDPEVLTLVAEDTGVVAQLRPPGRVPGQRGHLRADAARRRQADQREPDRGIRVSLITPSRASPTAHG